MPIYIKGPADREAGKLYLHDGTAAHPIAKVYDHDGTAAHEIYSASLPQTLMNGRFVDPAIGTWVVRQACYEEINWQWTSASSAATEGFTDLGYEIVMNNPSRCGKTLVTPTPLDFGGTASVTITGSKTRNTYYNAGAANNQNYDYMTVFLLQDYDAWGANALALAKVQLPGGWSNFTNASVTLQIPAGVVSAYLCVSMFSSDGACAITLKSVTTTDA